MRLQNIISQFFTTLGQLKPSFDFIYERQLWKGVHQYNWVYKAGIIAGILLSFKFMSLVGAWFTALYRVDSPVAFLSSVGHLAGGFFEEGYQSFTSGIMKYVILLLVEVLIFHFMQRTLHELKGQAIKTDLKTFVKAQVRMIKVVIRTYIKELLATILLSIVFGILGFLSWLEPAAIFLVQCYCFGLVILDNYHEQQGMKIKDSLAIGRQYIGVAIALGMVLYLLMLVPLVGVVVGTILVSVTAVLVMETQYQSNV